MENNVDTVDKDLEDKLYAQHAELKNLEDLMQQRGTPIPALFNQFYKFVQNPSSVSVETFKKMVDTDDTVGAGVDFLITCLCARMGQYQHKNPEVTKLVNEILDDVEGGKYNMLKDMFNASWAGFYVGEMVWKLRHDQKIGLKKIASLPPSTILFETDRVGEITDDGILQYQRNYNPALFATGTNYLFYGLGTRGSLNGFRNDPYAKFGDLPFPIRTANTYSYLSIRIPRLKCLHYSFDSVGKYGNPYGKSLLRRAYNMWLMKWEIWKMLVVALDRKGTPLTIVYANGQLSLIDPNKKNAAQGAAKGQGGAQTSIRADKAAQEAFKNIHNDSVMILPGKKDENFSVDVVNQNSNHDAFLASIQQCDRGIMRALLIPSLIFSSGDGSGSFALGQEHARTFDKILDGFLSGAQNVLLDQLVRQILVYNFPKEMWEKDGIGDFGKRQLTAEERDAEMKVFEAAVTMGAVDMNDLEDLNTIRTKAGFNERTEPMPEVENDLDDEDGEEEDNGNDSAAGKKPTEDSSDSEDTP